MDNSSLSPEEVVMPSDLLINEMISKLVLLLVAFIGIFGNSAAIFILSSSDSICKSKTYILLVNQSILDMMSTVFSCVIYALDGVLKGQNMSGIWDWMNCQFIKSGITASVTTCASSYNLSAMTMERCVSVVWPIFHRTHFTDRNIKISVVVIWIIGIAVNLPHSIPSNGISDKGVCHFWDGLSYIHARVQVITFNTLFTFIPLAAMIVSFLLMYNRIISHRLKVKMNVIKVLGTCVFLYFVCHAPHVVFDLVSRFSTTHLIREPMYAISVVFLGLNTMVNPIVYIIQFREYNREMKRQIRRLFRGEVVVK